MSDKIKNHLNNLLQKAFESHGVESYIKDDIIMFPEQRIMVSANFFDRTSSQAATAQLDINMEIGIGKTISESFAGMGNFLEEAVENAFENFIKNSFHVLLSAFFTEKFDNLINKEIWNIGEHKFDVYLGNIGCRGNLSDNSFAGFVDGLESVVKQQTLSEDIHWIRMFKSQFDNKITSSEILLDNDTWDEVAKDIDAIEFPLSKDYFSARVFAVLKAGIEIHKLASVIAWMALDDKFDEKVVALLMKEYGYSSIEAQKVNIFIPLAFGRVLIRRSSTVGLSNEAKITDSDEIINLLEEPIYVEAYKLAEHIMQNGCMDPDMFGAIAMCSSELDAFNQALNQGASIEDLNEANFGQTQIYFD